MSAFVGYDTPAATQATLDLPLEPVGGSLNLSPVFARGLQMSSVNVVLSIDTGVLSSLITE